jgi:hypothetical protein
VRARFDLCRNEEFAHIQVGLAAPAYFQIVKELHSVPGENDFSQLARSQLYLHRLSTQFERSAAGFSRNWRSSLSERLGHTSHTTAFATACLVSLD